MNLEDKTDFQGVTCPIEKRKVKDLKDIDVLRKSCARIACEAQIASVSRRIYADASWNQWNHLASRLATWRAIEQRGERWLHRTQWSCRNALLLYTQKRTLQRKCEGRWLRISDNRHDYRVIARDALIRFTYDHLLIRRPKIAARRPKLTLNSRDWKHHDF